jgi:hypothetical protein
MNHNRNIITSALLGLALFAPAIFAHGGFDHVQGTVVKVDNSVLTVKTAKGDVAVKLNAKTEITRENHAAKASDLTPNARVVVDVEEGDKTMTAHSIKIGVVAAPAKAAPAKHK